MLINEAIDLLIDIRNILRQALPNQDISEENLQEIHNNLRKIYQIIKELNEKFGFRPNDRPEKIRNFKEIIKDLFFIVNSSKNRKKLINIGFNPTQVLTTGGPITPNDIKTLNPNISESVLSQIQDKIRIFWKNLESKLRQRKYNKIILLLEKGNIADELLLKRKDKLEENTSIPVEALIISSFDHIENQLLTFLTVK
ncbi:MAG: DUF2100 domain-containing protein [Candidatus Helarchaeota archaeon]